MTEAPPGFAAVGAAPPGFVPMPSRRPSARQTSPVPIPEPISVDTVARSFERDRADVAAGNLPTSLADVPQQLAKGVRPAFVATGATVGGTLGIPAGPGGLLLGAGAGSSAGSFAFDTLNGILDLFGIDPLPGGAEVVEGDLMQTAANQIQAAMDEARTEMMFTGAFSAFFPIKRILTPAFGKLLGVRKNASKTMRQLAAAQGLELAAVDVGGPIAKGFARVLGIFPFISGPLRKGQLTKEAQLSGKFNEILNEIAPTASLSGELSVDLFTAAQKSDKKFRAVAAGLYNTLRDDMRRLPAPAIPTDELKAVTKKFSQEATLGDIPLAARPDGTPAQVLKGGVNEDFEKFLSDVDGIPSHLTYDQWAKVQQRLEGFIDQASPDPFTVKRVAQIKQAQEVDLNNIGFGIPDDVVSAEALEALRLRKQGADEWFANGIVVFQSPTAQKFGRIDKNIFRAGAEKQGPLNVDELMKPVFNTDSPQALRDLRALVGDDAFKRASRTHFDDVVSDSLRKEVRGGEDVQVFDLDAFQRNLGLVDGRKDKRKALEVMLEGTGVKVRDLDDLVDNARIMKINDPSVFVTRRAALGGAAGVVGALGVGGGLALGTAGAVGSPLIAVGATLLIRHGAKILADPKKLKALTAAFRPEISEINRRALLIRLARSLGEVPDEKEAE